MLVVFMMMAAEAVDLYLKLVIVLGQNISHYVIKISVICWGKFTIHDGAIISCCTYPSILLQLFQCLWYCFVLLLAQVHTCIQMCK